MIQSFWTMVARNIVLCYKKILESVEFEENHLNSPALRDLGGLLLR